jgi:hypothetical protein
MTIHIDIPPFPTLDIPSGFAAELSRTNPFLTGMGSQSIPLSLPSTELNRSLLGFAHRGTRTRRPSRRVPAIFQHDAIWMRGILVIDSYNPVAGISCTFYTNEGKLYESIANTKLGDIPWPVRNFANGVPEILDHLKLVMTDQVTADYDCFTALTSVEYDMVEHGRVVDTVNGFIQEYDRVYDPGPLQFRLNELGMTATLVSGQSHYTFDFFFLAKDVRKYRKEDTQITLPVGYGVTPFLKVSCILRHIFEHFGYTLNPNIFDTDPSLSRLVLINNTADAICAGSIQYRQLVPEQTEVTSFIDMIRKKFGIEFVERNALIDIVTWNRAITDAPDLDMSPFVAGDTTFQNVEPSSLFIKMDRSLTPEAATDTSTRNILISRYDNLNPITDAWAYNAGDLNFKMDAGFFFENRRYNINNIISSSFWDKLPDPDVAPENIEAGDVAVPSSFRVFHYKQSEYDPDHPNYYDLSPLIGGIRHLNSSVFLEKKKTAEEETPAELSLMMCFVTPGVILQKDTDRTSNFILKQGSCFNYKDRATSPWGTLNLTYTGPDNLYDAFYLHRDRMLRFANQLVMTPMKLPAETIQALDLSRPKTVNGMKVLIQQIDYMLGTPDICKVTARTLHLFPD